LRRPEWRSSARTGSRTSRRSTSASAIGFAGISSVSAAKRLTAPALVEVNLSGEDTKSGVLKDQLASFLDEARGLGAEVRGLMTMPPLADDPEASRPYFRELRELAQEHSLTELSMGTSQDYRVAAEEGATLVRVGSVVFGR
jgi:uncharacterized pyridoxal phosphate-containing UPF0001 family protein